MGFSGCGVVQGLGLRDSGPAVGIYIGGSTRATGVSKTKNHVAVSYRYNKPVSDGPRRVCMLNIAAVTMSTLDAASDLIAQFSGMSSMDCSPFS